MIVLASANAASKASSWPERTDNGATSRTSVGDAEAEIRGMEFVFGAVDAHKLFACVA
jgi:hypothetical protein